jgi:hypothetical protein
MQEVVNLADRVKSQKLSTTICKMTVRNDGRVKENTIMLQNKPDLLRGEIRLFDRFYGKKMWNNEGSKSPKHR